MRALQADSEVRRDGPHDVHPLAERSDHSGVRAQETGFPDRGQYADDAWVDWAHDGIGSGDDTWVRRLRREYHVGQHLAAAFFFQAEDGIRDYAGREAVRTRRRGNQ